MEEFEGGNVVPLNEQQQLIEEYETLQAELVGGGNPEKEARAKEIAEILNLEEVV